VAQSISYEVCISIIIIHCFLFFQYDLNKDKLSPLDRFLFAVILILVVTSLAETNRSPFDFAEGESELVRGFNTEYSSVSFVFIFLAEYISILFISTILRALFNIRGYWDLFLFI